MSVSNALQTLIYQRLTTYAPLVALVGTRVYDRPNLKAVAPYVTFGPSDYTTEDYDCFEARIEALQIDVWSEAQDGFRECKAICDAIRDALHRYDANATVGALQLMDVTQVRVFRDPDGITSHGVVTIEAHMEEP